MNMKQLLEFIDKEKETIEKRFNRLDKEKRILAQNLKLTEEVGEFTNEVLLKLSLARDEKLENMDKNNINNEFADVIITALVLARTLDIDPERALENRINKLKERWDI